MYETDQEKRNGREKIKKKCALGYTEEIRKNVCIEKAYI